MVSLVYCSDLQVELGVSLGMDRCRGDQDPLRARIRSSSCRREREREQGEQCCKGDVTESSECTAIPLAVRRAMQHGTQLLDVDRGRLSLVAASSESDRRRLSSLSSPSTDSLDSFSSYSSTDSIVYSSPPPSSHPSTSAASSLRSTKSASSSPPPLASPDAMADADQQQQQQQQAPASSPDAALEATRDQVASLSLDEAASPRPPHTEAADAANGSSPLASPSARQGEPAVAQPVLSPSAALPTAAPSASSPISPPPVPPTTSSASPSPSPSPSTSTSAAQPPPLYPRASAPPASSGAPLRRPPAPGAGGALKAGVRGAVPGSAGPLKMPPSLAAKMAAVRPHLSPRAYPFRAKLTRAPS